MCALIFVRLIFIAAIDYENIFTKKIPRFTVHTYMHTHAHTYMYTYIHTDFLDYGFFNLDM